MQIAQVMAGYSLGEADCCAACDGQEDPLRDGAAARNVFVAGRQDNVSKAQAIPSSSCWPNSPLRI